MTKITTHHPESATLLSFAAGSLSEALAAVVASHVSMCGACRNELQAMERLGFALLAETAADQASGLSRLPSMPDRPQALPGFKTVERVSDKLPEPIVRAYGIGFETVPWRRLGPGVWHYQMALSPGSEGDLRLLKINPGRKMPVHGHGGAELTLVLDGAYSDETGRYLRGDVQDVDDEVEHRPVADAEHGCICLIASEKPARFKGLIGRLMQPWTRM